MTQLRCEKYTYAILTQFTTNSPDPNNKLWGQGKRKDFILKELVANDKTTMSVMGQDHRQERYSDRIDLKLSFRNTPEGLKVDTPRQQRLYNWRNWPNAVELRFENVTFK